MTDYESSQDKFNKNVSKHEMTVELDQGVHRCLLFKAPGTINRYFRLTTWPGHLCVSGDMGTYVFARTPDMFKFFRGDGVNPSYWGEKLQAGVPKEYCPDAFMANVRQEIEDSEITEEEAEEIIEKLERHADDGEHYAVSAALDHFPEFYEYSNRKYTYHFIWCLRAIVWGIKKYDKEAQK